MRVLSIDVGLRNCGLAVSSLDQSIIYPLPQISLDEFSGRIFCESLKKDIAQMWNEIGSVVIGKGDMYGRSSVCKAIDQVCKVLKSWTNWKIILVSEVNSTVESKRFLRRIGSSRSKLKKKKDSYAALLLLNDYFESKGKQVLVSF